MNRCLTGCMKFCVFSSWEDQNTVTDGNFVYLVLNRANPRMTIFERDDGDEAFLRGLEEAVDRTNTRLSAYCLMPEREKGF